MKMVAVDTEFNMTSREEYLSIADVTAYVISQLIAYNSEVGSIFVGADVSDDSGSVVAIAYVSLPQEPDYVLDARGIPLTDGVGNATFTNLDPEQTYIIELFVRDPAWNNRSEFRERVPNGAGFDITP